MQIAVCDDEPMAATQIKKTIEEYSTDEVKTFFLADDLLKSDKGFDLIILDIRMPGMTGIDAAKKIREMRNDVDIIFVTNEKDYVFDAFDVEAVHYLLKPVDAKKLYAVLDKVRSRKERMLLDGEFVLIETRWSTYQIRKADILYVESQGKKCLIHTDSRQVDCYGTMAEYEEKLGTSFYRCHRSYLVNIDHIVGYTSDKIELQGGGEVFMAKNRYDDFVKTFLHHQMS